MPSSACWHRGLRPLRFRQSAIRRRHCQNRSRSRLQLQERMGKPQNVTVDAKVFQHDATRSLQIDERVNFLGSCNLRVIDTSHAQSISLDRDGIAEAPTKSSGFTWTVSQLRQFSYVVPRKRGDAPYNTEQTLRSRHAPKTSHPCQSWHTPILGHRCNPSLAEGVLVGPAGCYVAAHALVANSALLHPAFQA